VTREYFGDLVLIVPTGEFAPGELDQLVGCFDVIILEFPRRDVPILSNRYYRSKSIDNSTAWGYFLKFNLFHESFKRWQKVLFVDGGMKVQKPLRHILDLPLAADTILAHSDAYPDYVWRLRNQFFPSDFPDRFISPIGGQLYASLTTFFLLRVCVCSIYQVSTILRSSLIWTLTISNRRCYIIKPKSLKRALSTISMNLRVSSRSELAINPIWPYISALPEKNGVKFPSKHQKRCSTTICRV